MPATEVLNRHAAAGGVERLNLVKEIHIGLGKLNDIGLRGEAVLFQTALARIMSTK